MNTRGQKRNREFVRTEEIEVIEINEANVASNSVEGIVFHSIFSKIKFHSLTKTDFVIRIYLNIGFFMIFKIGLKFKKEATLSKSLRNNGRFCHV